MNVKDVYLKTMKFNLIKLGLGAAVIGISLVLLLLCGGITFLCNNPGVTWMMILIWIVGTSITYKLLMYYVG